MRPGLLHHRKFARLARLVGSEPAALGHLEMLWAVAYENGDDLLGDAGDVEYLGRWPGPPGVLASALVEAGFLDETKEGYRVHDLWDHAPEYVAGRRDREGERKKPKTCVACGTGFHSPDSRAAHCGARCRTAAYRERTSPCDGRVRFDPSHVTDAPSPVTDCDGTPAHAHAPKKKIPCAVSQSEPRSVLRERQPDCLTDQASLESLRQRLGEALGVPLGIGKSPQRVARVFGRFLAALGEEALVAECVALAPKCDTGVPKNLAWFVGWLETISRRELEAAQEARQRVRGPGVDA